MIKKINYPSEQALTLTIPSFENGVSTTLDHKVATFSTALDVQNFSFSDGALKNGIGFSDILPILSINDNLETLKRDIDSIGSIYRTFQFYKYDQEKSERQDKLIMIDSELKVYYINLYEEAPKLYYLRDITFTSLPEAVRYRLNSEDVIILTSPTDNMVVWNGVDEPYQVLDAPKISSMAIHYERLFATVDGEKNSVWFSDDLDPTNWSLNLEEAGFIELIDERGALIKVVSFCDYIYIFREYGISRLSAYGDQTNFAVSNLFVSSGKIYDKSVCVCGDKIIFLASDGLYKFDGVDTTKILPNIANNISFIADQEVSACYYSGNYYLSCKYRFKDSSEDEQISNALLKIDINTLKLKNITKGVDIKHLTCLICDKFSGVLATASQTENFNICYISDSCLFFDNTLKKTYLSATSGIENSFDQKTLKKIYIETEGDITLTIFHDKQETSYTFQGSKKQSCKRVNIPLNYFSFKITSTDQTCAIRKIKFLFGKSQRE